MADEVKLIDAELLTTNIAQIAKNCARSDAQKALIGRILYMIENMPTIEAEPVKHAQWIRKHNSFPQRYFCTECGGGDVGIFTFCPYCGYKMGG